ncbi:hypothetical protein B7Y94_03410 [Candidatus Saccharibacteria bacterium 32-49-12]|nr:MAG: hypothetical protein B7Y94_03410 [Candidatus Saccharibacteria bacterium 32-49-12]
MSESAAGQLPPKGEQLADDEIVIPEAFAATLVDKEIVANTEQLVGETVSLTVVRPPSSLSAEQISAAFASGGQAAVEALGQPETKTYDYTVKALSKQSSTALAASSSIQVSPNQARELTEYTTQGTEAYQKYVGVTALAKGDRDPAEVKASIESAGYAAQTARDLQSLIFTIVNTLQGIVLGFGVIALIASVFGIINTQYISVLERTREIGLMKALGMRGGSVSRLFQFEAAWIGLLGGVIGAVIAVLVGTALNPTITEALTLGDGNYLLIFELVPIVIMIVSLVLIAMLAGWFPARKAAKLDPIEALRTE